MARDRLSKRDAIVEAVKALLWERGYQAMSPRDVLARSGAGQGSLYHHFEGKLACAVAALQEVAAEEVAAIDAIFAAPAPPLLRVRNYLQRERDALRGCRLARLANEAAIGEPAFRQPIAAFLDRIAGHLEENLAAAQQSGALPDQLDRAALAAALVAAVEGGFILARAHWDPARMTQAIAGAIQLLDAVSGPNGDRS
ncbi:MAG: TetR family transcriptional regulator [Azospirillum sp.]|nr:TetR family transcriptional regulator [Azospirillum sp.]